LSDRDTTIRERQLLRSTYGTLFDDIASILFEEDPIGINFETNKDEYEPEVGTILPRLANARSVDDVERILHEEFCRWFDNVDVGPKERYRFAAQKVWLLWLAARN
jgi:hypothetical protein